MEHRRTDAVLYDSEAALRLVDRELAPLKAGAAADPDARADAMRRENDVMRQRLERLHQARHRRP
jgi:hypothetical protein